MLRATAQWTHAWRWQCSPLSYRPLPCPLLWSYVRAHIKRLLTANSMNLSLYSRSVWVNAASTRKHHKQRPHASLTTCVANFVSMVVGIAWQVNSEQYVTRSDHCRATVHCMYSIAARNDQLRATMLNSTRRLRWQARQSLQYNSLGLYWTYNRPTANDWILTILIEY